MIRLAASRPTMTANEKIALCALDTIGDAGLLERELIDGPTFSFLRLNAFIRPAGDVWVITPAGRDSLRVARA